MCRKGFRKLVDSYSAFFENDHVTATGLEAYLKTEGVKRIFVVGVAYDFCVRYSCEDAAKAGFESVLVKDATRARWDCRGRWRRRTEASTRRGCAR